jgi:hypothetical protein
MTASNPSAGQPSGAVKHTRTGNCWASEVIYGCRKCGSAAMEIPACDVCHKHEAPRGLCEECPPCPVCDKEAREA